LSGTPAAPRGADGTRPPAALSDTARAGRHPGDVTASCGRRARARPRRRPPRARHPAPPRPLADRVSGPPDATDGV